MDEVCYCGWSGAVADKIPLSLDGAKRGVLLCPRCGRVDFLEGLRPAQREALLELAQVGQMMREVADSAAA